MTRFSCVALGVFAFLISALAVTDAFYIPGVQPRYYAEGDEVHFWVNSLRSLQVLFPKEYYTLPFCRPSEIITKDESIGEIIWGDRIQNSLYVTNMKKNTNCTVLPNCDAVANTKTILSNIDDLEGSIEKGYRGFMNIDNLPVFGEVPPDLLAHCASVPKDMRHTFYRGYWIGTPSACTGKTLINNHLEFVIKYNHAPHDPNKFMVVGLKATPYSIKHSDDGLSCNADMSATGSALDYLTTDDVRGGAVVHWSYGVKWEKSDVIWATRWDEYLHSSVADSSPAFHWLYVCSSLVVVLMCAASVATILMRTLHKDFSRYNSPVLEDGEEESGWKLVHADVFRPPDRAPLLAALTGNGYQVLGMSAGTMLFALLGFLSPARRGALLSAVIFLFVFMSVVSGYVCGFLLKYFGRCEWKHIFFCGCAFPGAIVGVYTFANIINYSHGSSGTIPFSLLFILLSLWILISVPLTVLGASFSFRQESLANPVAVGRLAREIPPQTYMNRTLFLLVVPPIFPLCTIILELNFVLQALWSGQVYYVFGFLALVSFIWVIITALVTVFHLYYVLCRENHQWWWPAFFIPGGFGVPLFVYSIFFYMTQLAIHTFASSLLYFLYMGLISYAYGLAAGAVGLTSGIMFVRKIYGSIKVD
ncbi:endosomal integral membrane protein, putative [Trypanosoma brucei brucei TREU927]|uniref:Transmembrane 9 superfamily member n=1 Tax=Trypanosoma brucei brucei (strain 927/4 GUTat10.1) TaxID=185431 RepID=Q580M3_TRYB2|nr:endosomal integral membrane protein, putative [Trypanosoma brucei brucei TREU927]AAX79324.1 endosomal integral membrane protein, putative [Trypanosoma brucei]AAZ10452.1 endosomal integral membrane protein, putative [Trypanosoma brucei brucei TREU927]